MHTVAFYSYKGGVGRTLLLANTARFLALAGKKVVALDLDLEAPGLHYKLGAPEVLARARDGALHGAVDQLLAVLSDAGGRSIADFAVAVDLPPDGRGSLQLIPAGSAPSGRYWTALAKLVEVTRAESAGGGIAEAVLDLQARIADELAPDFLLVDARTGITELGGLATTIVADRVVCLTSTSPESIDGTLAVASALRAAPRLPGQGEIDIEFLLARVDVVDPPGATLVPSGYEIEILGSRVESESRPEQQSELKLTFSAILPHDRTIANEERVLGGERVHDRRATLFQASLGWIEKSFPGLAAEAELARKRMAAVDRAWHQLTDARVGSESGWHWPSNRLRAGVRFRRTDDVSAERFADIIAYDRPASEPDAKPILVVEYVTNEDYERVAQWWHLVVGVGIVCLLEEGRQPGWQLFAISNSQHGPRRSGRWDLPTPRDFEALPDPSDLSIETLIDAIRRGYSEYVPRLTTEWALATSSPLHTSAPWVADHAHQIVDGLAVIDDVEQAMHVLLRISPDWHERGTWLDSLDDWLQERIWRELFTPLWWRLPVEASMAVARMRGMDGAHGPPLHRAPLRALSEEFLGLRYEPDVAFRRGSEAALSRMPQSHDPERRHDIGQVASAFRLFEITFEQRASNPPIGSVPYSLDGKVVLSETSITELIQHLIQNRFVVTTGLLGNYEPEQGRVVIFDAAIKAVASKLGIPYRSLATITLLHETIHALTHVGRDLDGRMWPEFALPSAASPLFEPSAFHSAIAQYFSYQFLLHLRDRKLLDAFEKLTDHQPTSYQRWRQMKYIPIEEMRSWLVSVRRGMAGAHSRLSIFM